MAQGNHIVREFAPKEARLDTKYCILGKYKHLLWWVVHRITCHFYILSIWRFGKVKRNHCKYKVNNIAHMGNNFQYTLETLCLRKYND